MYTLTGRLFKLYIIILCAVVSHSLNAMLINEEGTQPTLYVSFDDCAAFGDGSSSDYSEFTAETTASDVCSEMSLVGGHVYRDSASVNTHSCTPGIQDSPAMCISASGACEYGINNDKALRFDVRVIPGPDGLGSLEEISFFSQAPEQFNYIDGPMGPNNYPLFIGVRILKDGQEIYREEDIPTERTWTQRVFDFDNLPEFLVDDTTVFHVSILPYCPVGIQSFVEAWDIDELIITGGCHNIRGGIITSNAPDVLCSTGTSTDSIEFEVTGEVGDNTSWIIVDESGVIVAVNNDGNFDFNSLSTERYTVYHISYTDDTQGLSAGNEIDDITGCFDLSNGITISNRQVRGGQLLVDGNFMVEICTAEGQSEDIIVDLNDAIGTGLIYLLTDSVNIILDFQTNDTFNFEGMPSGSCLIYAMSFEGQVMNFSPGNNISEITGCFELSSPVGIFRTFVDGGELSTDSGSTDVMLCNGQGNALVDLVIQNATGDSSTLIIVDESMTIVSLPDSNTIDLSLLPSGTYEVYNISWSDQLTGLTAGNMIEQLMGCFALSNPLNIDLLVADGGELMDESGNVTASFCIDDTEVDLVIPELTGAIGDSMSYLLVDTSGLIINIIDGDTIDLDGLAAGNYLLYNISYHAGIANLQVGNPVSGIDGCFDLSNAIEITIVDIEGGILEINGGATEADVCTGDGNPDIIDLEASGFTGPNSLFLITDTSGLILNTSSSDMIDFENAGEGICLIYNISFIDSTTVQGDSLNINELSGCFALSNAVTINRTEVDGGMLMTTDSLTEISIIVGDGIPDSIDLILENAVGDTMGWIVTDSLGQILSLPDSFPVDFESQDTGVCFIYNISFVAPLTGLNIGDNISDLVGCFDLSNPVIVNRNTLSGGTIMTADSMTIVSICAGDGIADPIDVILEEEDGSNSAWIVTDTSGLILSLPAGPPFDLEGAGGGICLIWHISYEDGLTGLDVGNNISDLSGLFDLSNNITVDRLGVNGGELMTTDSLTFVEVCSGDGEADEIDVLLSGTEGDSMQWIITDSSLMILNLPSAPPFDFEGVSEGTCFIWNLAWSGSITGLQIGSSLDSLEGCYDLSNAIGVAREEIDGGVLMTTMGTDTVEIIAGDGIPDSFDVTLTDTIGEFSAWIITNSDDVIIGLPPGPPFDLENAGGGTCRIWHLSYNDVQMLEFGMELTDITGCFDLSNPITVIRTGLNGGMLTAADGSMQVELCIIDMMADSVDVILTDTIGSFSAWAITDSSGLILAVPSGPPFDFSGAEEGICQIWHISYEAGLMGLEVDSLLTDLEGTFHLSNPLDVIREPVDGGNIMTTDSLTEVMLMVGDGMPDIVEIILENAEGDSSIYIVTDSSGLILNITDSNSFDFEDAGSGQCQIWHVSYSGTLSGLTVGENIDGLSGCFDISNPVTVNRSGLNGGILTTVDLETSVDLCVGDGIFTPINVILTDTVGPMFQWLITDTSGLILATPTAPPFNLEPAGAGICQIWNMAFEPGLTGDTIGGNLSTLSGEFDLSNPLTVNREAVNGGTIMTTDSLTNITITVGEGIDDTIDVLLMSEIGDSSIWVITSDSGEILDLQDNPPFLFEDSGPGICMIWHLSYNTGLTGLVEGNDIDQLVGCFEFSNPITVTKEAIDGGLLTDITGATEVFICVDDMVNDTIEVILTDAMGPVSDWVITDITGTIISLPAGPPFVLDTINLTSCVIYHISSDGTLMGLTIGVDIGSLTGGFSLSNPLTVLKGEAAGGMLMTSDSLTEVTIEVGEGVNDTIDVILTGAEGDSSLYVVTDTLGNIIDFPAGPPFLFEDSGAGVCQLWHLSYSGPINGLVIGDNISGITGCYEFSNAITITKEGVNGGILTTITGETDTIVCVGDGENDNIQLMLTNTMGDNFNWVLTFEDSTIIGIPIGPPFNFENSPVIGNTLIWHLAYDSIMPPVDNNLIGQGLDVFTGNFDFSNPVIVMKDEVDGGDISTSDPTNIIVGDGIVDTINVTLEDEVGELMMYLVVNSTGNILSFQTDTIFTFENSGAGTCNIYHVSYYAGASGLVIGNNISNLDGCIDLSNPIAVTKSTNSPLVSSEIIEYDMYPVPASDVLHFEFRKLPSGQGTLSILNHLGQRVSEHDIEGRYLDVRLDGFLTGIYYIKINAGATAKTDRLMIIR